jgi:glutathione peroxidase
MSSKSHFLQRLVALSFWVVLMSLLPLAAAAQGSPGAACPALLNHTFPRLQDEAPQSLCQYSGKVVLVVNTASYCGFTRQYEGLEALYAHFEKRGLVILGFPSNDFGRQEPGNAQQIADLCFNTYGVRFPMFSKAVVKGAGRHPFYAQLAQATQATPQWNFHKYLVGRDGKTVSSFDSAVEPGSAKLVAAIEAALKTRP